MESEILEVLKALDENKQLLNSLFNNLTPAFDKMKSQMTVEQLAEYEKTKAEISNKFSEINNLKNGY